MTDIDDAVHATLQTSFRQLWKRVRAFVSNEEHPESSVEQFQHNRMMNYYIQRSRSGRHECNPEHLLFILRFYFIDNAKCLSDYERTTAWTIHHYILLHVFPELSLFLLAAWEPPHTY